MLRKRTVRRQDKQDLQGLRGQGGIAAPTGGRREAIAHGVQVGWWAGWTHGRRGEASPHHGSPRRRSTGRCPIIEAQTTSKKISSACSPIPGVGGCAVVGAHHHGQPLQARLKGPLAGDMGVVSIQKCAHARYCTSIQYLLGSYVLPYGSLAGQGRTMSKGQVPGQSGLRGAQGRYLQGSPAKLGSCLCRVAVVRWGCCIAEKRFRNVENDACCFAAFFLNMRKNISHTEI